MLIRILLVPSFVIYGSIRPDFVGFRSITFFFYIENIYVDFCHAYVVKIIIKLPNPYLCNHKKSEIYFAD